MRRFLLMLWWVFALVGPVAAAAADAGPVRPMKGVTQPPESVLTEREVCSDHRPIIEVS